MKKPEESVLEGLWKQIAPEVEPAIQAVQSGQRTKSARIEMIRAVARICYTQGVCRGYDLGFHVFGDGDEPVDVDDDSDNNDDNDSDDEPVSVDDNGEPT